MGRRSIAYGDLNRDGTIDLITVSFLDDRVYWYPNNGNGTFAARRTISTTADGATSVFVADLDGDGDLDVVSSYLDDTIAWYENNGAATPAFTLHTISTTADGATSVIAVDLDRDGDMDVVSTSFLDNKIAWYKNDGSQGFTLITISTTAGWPCR